MDLQLPVMLSNYYANLAAFSRRQFKKIYLLCRTIEKNDINKNGSTGIHLLS